jgi:uncharacterized membrane protein
MSAPAPPGFWEILFRGIHALTVAAWLLFDFIVYWLHFDIKNPKVELAARLERAHIMHAIDRIVLYVFILTLPVGIILCFLTDTPLFTTTWLNWKHLMYAVIIIAAILLIPISGTAIRNLKAIEAGAPNVDELNTEIRRDMNIGMPFVFLIWISIIGMSLISVFNLKHWYCGQYLFR